MTPYGAPPQKLIRAHAASGLAAARVSRLPPGHRERKLVAFVAICGKAAQAIRPRRDGKKLAEEVDFLDVADGLVGMALVDACIRTSTRVGAWTKISDRKPRPTHHADLRGWRLPTGAGQTGGAMIGELC